MKKELQFQNDYLFRKDPKLMSLGELDAYLSSKTSSSKLIDNSNINNSPLRNDTSIISNPFIGDRTQPSFIVPPKEKQSDPQVNTSKCGNDYIKSLQDKIMNLTIENNEIKTNFIKVSELLNKEREESNRQSEMLRNTKSSSNSHTNSNSNSNELNDYKNKVKCLFQENKQLIKTNEELNKKLMLVNERNAVFEEEKRKEYEGIVKQKELGFNKIVNELNSQIDQLKLQLSYINKDNGVNDANEITPNIKKIKPTNYSKKFIPYSNYSKIPTYAINSHNDSHHKSKQITSLTPIRNHSNKPQPNTHTNDKPIYKSPYQLKMEALVNKKSKKVKKKKTKQNNNNNNNVTNSNNDIDYTYINTNANTNINTTTCYNPSLSNRSYNHGNSSNINRLLNHNNNFEPEQSKYDYDLSTDKVIVNPTSTITSSLDRLVIENNTPPVYSPSIMSNIKQGNSTNVPLNNSNASFQMNCFSSQQQGVDPEKERLNQLNQVVIRIQLLEQNIEQLKSSYQTFLSIMQTGVTEDEATKIKESLNKISSNLEDKTYKLLSLKKEQQELLKKSLIAKKNSNV